MTRTISKETALAAAHILKEAQRRATQTQELIGELLELIGAPNKPDDDAWSDVADVVYAFDTVHHLFERFDISVDPEERKYAENELRYSPTKGWHK